MTQHDPSISPGSLELPVSSVRVRPSVVRTVAKEPFGRRQWCSESGSERVLTRQPGCVMCAYHRKTTLLTPQNSRSSVRLNLTTFPANRTTRPAAGNSWKRTFDGRWAYCDPQSRTCFIRCTTEAASYAALQKLLQRSPAFNVKETLTQETPRVIRIVSK